MGIKAKANKDVIKVTIDQYDLEKAFSSNEEYQHFLDELLINIRDAKYRYRLKGDKSFKNWKYEQHLKKIKGGYKDDQRNESRTDHSDQ